MEENSAGKKCGMGSFVALFVIGFLGSLVVGWWVFPQLLYSKQEQPIRFSHPLHKEQGKECKDCHYTRPDGTYSGKPNLASCTDCHSSVLSDDPDDKKFYEEFVEKEKEVPWVAYQKQPDNVFFSHAAHEQLDCTECHPDVANMEKPGPVYVNRVTGYTKDTMKMWQCERCHANNGVSNACYVCHK